MISSAAWFGEYQALTSATGISDLTGRGRIEVRGGDRARFLHSFCTNDIQRLTPGTGCEAFVTNHQGKTVGHVFVFCSPESLLLDAVAGQAAGLIAHLDRFVISDDVSFLDRTEDGGELLVAGPQAGELLSRLCEGPAPSNVWDHFAAAIGGQQVQVARVDFLLPASYFLTAPRADLKAIGDALIAAGAAPCSAAAVESVRLESGTPLFGCDITHDNFPQEIRRDTQAISFTKGCYLGQETVARIDAMGHVNRLLAGVRFLGGEASIPAPGTELRSGEKVVGHVTGAAWSPQLNQPLALALLRRAQATIGTTLDSPHGPAEVLSLPLLRP